MPNLTRTNHDVTRFIIEILMKSLIVDPRLSACQGLSCSSTWKQSWTWLRTLWTKCLLWQALWFLLESFLLKNLINTKGTWVFESRKITEFQKYWLSNHYRERLQTATPQISGFFQKCFLLISLVIHEMEKR